MSGEAVTFSGAARMRVRIVNPHHPHAGVTGMCDPTAQKNPGGTYPPMALITFDEPHLGIEAAYASADELERAPRR